MKKEVKGNHHRGGRNSAPHNILPAAIGEPILIGAVFMLIAFKMKKG